MAGLSLSRNRLRLASLGGRFTLPLHAGLLVVAAPARLRKNAVLLDSFRKTLECRLKRFAFPDDNLCQLPFPLSFGLGLILLMLLACEQALGRFQLESRQLRLEPAARLPRAGPVKLQGLVSRGQYLWLQQRHRHPTALDFAVPGLDAEDLCAALLALESFAELVRHVRPLLLDRHRLAAAREIAFATFGDDHLGAALAALVSLADLVCHVPLL